MSEQYRLWMAPNCAQRTGAFDERTQSYNLTKLLHAAENFNRACKELKVDTDLTPQQLVDIAVAVEEGAVSFDGDRRDAPDPPFAGLLGFAMAFGIAAIIAATFL